MSVLYLLYMPHVSLSVTGDRISCGSLVSKDCDGSITTLHPMSVYSIIAILLCMSHSRDARNVVWYFRDWDTRGNGLCRKGMRVVSVL